MGARNSQAGIALMAVVVMLLLIPLTVLVLHQQSTAFRVSAASESAQVELNYVLDAAAAHAAYLADQNRTCINFADVPATTFGDHTYAVTIVQDPILSQRLLLKVAATLSNGIKGSRRVLYTAYEPEIVADLRPVADLTADSAQPTQGNGTGNTLVVRKDLTSQAYALLKFELAGVLPPDTRISHALMKTDVKSLAFTGDLSATNWLSAHSLTRRWSELGNWDTHDGNKNWRPAGGVEPGHPTSPIASWQGLPAGTISIDLTTTVQRWMKQLDTFYGVLLKSSLVPLTLQLASREDSDLNARPRLELAYSCPCGQTCQLYPRREYADFLQAEVDAVTDIRTCDTDGDYRGSNGDIRWTFNAWREVGDDGNSCTGLVRMDQDPVVPDDNAFQVLLTGDTKSLQRDAWLLGAAEVVASFKYRRVGLVNDNQRVLLRASNGGGWTTLLTIGNSTTDVEYQMAAVDIPAALVGEETAFEFFAENLNSLRHIYIDDFSVSFSGAVSAPLTLKMKSDSYLNEDKGNNSYTGDNPLLLMHENSQDMRTIVKVETGGLLPGELVTKATLRMWVEENRTDRDTTISLYALDENWNDTAVTWMDSDKNIIEWSVPGGAFTVPSDPLDVPTIMLSPGAESLWLEFDITAMVQSWNDYPGTNNGLIMIMDDTGRGKEINITAMEEGTKSLRPHVELQL